MLERKESLALILKGCGEKLAEHGFTNVIPADLEKGSAPIFVDGENAYVEFTKNDLTIRLLSHDNLLDIMEKVTDGEFIKISSNLCELADYDERDIKSLCNEINDTVISSHGKKAKQAAKKAPTTVSKTAAKNGADYDAYTLASRIAGVYPDLKYALKDNVQDYPEFLAEDFFVNHANKVIYDSIRINDRQTIKKLMRILSEIYENGTNDVQDLVVVTILGELNNDKELLDRCVAEITDDDFRDTVIAVNKYLASGAGKKAKELLKNPPKYKPPKKKNGGMMSALMQGAAGGMPPQQ